MATRTPAPEPAIEVVDPPVSTESLISDGIPEVVGEVWVVTYKFAEEFAVDAVYASEESMLAARPNLTPDENGGYMDCDISGNGYKGIKMQVLS